MSHQAYPHNTGPPVKIALIIAYRKLNVTNYFNSLG